MKHSLAVIQLPLFEGWSTVVEGAKAMNQFVILSDIRVHKEQMQDNVVFFNPLDEYDLADKICNSKIIKTQINYQESVMRFGEGFLELIGMTKNKTTL